MKTIYQQGEQAEIRVKLDGSKPEAITIIYRNKDELPKLEAEAAKMAETWKPKNNQ